jgi:hypothetical protein
MQSSVEERRSIKDKKKPLKKIQILNCIPQEN